MAVKSRSNVPEKIRAGLQQEIDSTCPFCMNTDVGHFQVHHIDENPSNNDVENLLMLCPCCHSKITKGDIPQVKVRGIKRALLDAGDVRRRPASTQTNNFQGSVENSVVGIGNKVTIKTIRKAPKQKYPPGCIGFDVVKANYISYLIRRYHDFKEWEVGKNNMRYQIFPSQLKRQFKIGSQRTIYNAPEFQFKAICQYIQGRIHKTKLARTKKGVRKLFQDFDEYVQGQSATKHS